jgi:hypothetical protein
MVYGSALRVFNIQHNARTVGDVGLGAASSGIPMSNS